MTRVAACIGISRIIRSIAFLLTILPSPRPGCYIRRFPAVPDSWSQYLRIGFGQLRGSGGCNDLVISGHCIIYVMAPLAFQTYYPGWTAALLWLAVIRSCIRVRRCGLPACAPALGCTVVDCPYTLLHQGMSLCWTLPIYTVMSGCRATALQCPAQALVYNAQHVLCHQGHACGSAPADAVQCRHALWSLGALHLPDSATHHHHYTHV